MGRPLESRVYELLDTHEVLSCFTRFSAGISANAASVEQAMHRIAIQASTADSRERRRALTRHSNPHGNAFAICHCSAEPDRLVLLASLIEIMWIHDDVTEELDHVKACEEHAILKEVIRLDIEPSEIPSGNIRQKALSAVVREAIDMDQDEAHSMIDTLRDYLDSFDSRDDDFNNMEEYILYRISNCGYWISSYFIRWGMGITLTKDDYSSIQAFDVAMGNVLGLTNDYFSWNVEKDQPTDRIRNAVRVLMREHGIDSEAAQLMLLGIIVQEESRAAKLKQERLRSPVSREVSRYFEAIELYVGGSCYWHSTAPRYQVAE